MAIIKSKHASNYTVIPNEIYNQGLSMEALGLLCYLLSMPHDWTIYKTTLHTQMNCGVTKLDSAFKELQNSGYILSAKRQKENGRIEHEHIVYDKPYNGEPPHGEPPMENPPMVNPQLLSTNKQSTNKQSKHKEKKEKEEKEKKFYRKFKHLKLTFEEFDKLIEQGFSEDSIKNVLDSIENYSKNTKYTSLYLTCLKWLKNEINQNSQNPILNAINKAY